MIKNESSTNLNCLRTPPISPVVTSTHGFAHGHYHNSGEHYHSTPSPGSRPCPLTLGTQRRPGYGSLRWIRISLCSRRWISGKGSPAITFALRTRKTYHLRMSVTSWQFLSARTSRLCQWLVSLRLVDILRCIFSWVFMMLLRRRTVPRRPRCLLARGHLRHPLRLPPL